MPVIRTSNSGQNRNQYSQSKANCPGCRLHHNGPQPTWEREQDIPEWQANPRDPSFISLRDSLGAFDIDALSASVETQVRRAEHQAIASGAIVLRSIVSTLLLSPSFSPPERAHILDGYRRSFTDQFHLDDAAFGRILSEPLLSLGGVSPLEYEIVRWDPIWEDAGGVGGQSAISAGMETIQFFIEYWQPSPQAGSDQPNEEPEIQSQNDELRNEAVLISIVRDACLRRLSHTCPKAGVLPSVELEDTTNRLFQRLIRLVCAQRLDKENAPLNLTRVDTEDGIHVADYSAAVSYTAASQISQQFWDGRGRGNLATFSSMGKPEYNEKAQEFTVLISIPHFSATRRNASAPARSMLNVEFFSLGRAWALGVGKNMLELSVFSSFEKNKTGSGEIESERTEFSEDGEVEAEVRLVAPKPSQPIDAEYVFTFPTMHVPAFFPCEKTKRTAARASKVSVAPCFSRLHSLDADVKGFDDSHILHANDGELLLELRVRYYIRSAPLAKPASPLPKSLANSPFRKVDSPSERESEFESQFAAVDLPLSSDMDADVDVDVDTSSTSWYLLSVPTACTSSAVLVSRSGEASAPSNRSISLESASE
ncbi:hypothetical protein DFH11DRAFT_1603583 [Phellopilus nigrolimitatus]|nr:hypothetical protein DFH11DRAFT_1603583 [Phellopilus nigrolimitatus]